MDRLNSKSVFCVNRSNGGILSERDAGRGLSRSEPHNAERRENGRPRSRRLERLLRGRRELLLVREPYRGGPRDDHHGGLHERPPRHVRPPGRGRHGRQPGQRVLHEPWRGGQPPPPRRARDVPGHRGHARDGRRRGGDDVRGRGRHEPPGRAVRVHERADALRRRVRDEPGVRWPPGQPRPRARATEILPAELHAREAPVLVHLADHDGPAAVRLQDADPERDLPVDHGPVPVLPAEPAALAELHPPLAFFQRLLHQGPALLRQARKGLVLGAAPRLGKHVRERLLPAAAEALQVRDQGVQGARRGGEALVRGGRGRGGQLHGQPRSGDRVAARARVPGEGDQARRCGSGQRVQTAAAARGVHHQPRAPSVSRAPDAPALRPSSSSSSSSPSPALGARARRARRGTAEARSPPAPSPLLLQPPVLHQQPHVGAAEPPADVRPGHGLRVRLHRRLRGPLHGAHGRQGLVRRLHARRHLLLPGDVLPAGHELHVRGPDPGLDPGLYWGAVGAAGTRGCTRD